MREFLFVTWTAETLRLSRLPIEGIWESQPDFLSSFENPRPTRTDRMLIAASRTNLEEAIKELVRDKKIDVDIWFLFPSSWALKFRIQCPDFNSPDQIRDHLLWEASHYLTDDIADFHVTWNQIDQNKYQVTAIRKSLFITVVNAVKDSGLENVHFGIEPEPKLHYEFKLESDLTRPVEKDEELAEISISHHKRRPSGIFLIISILAIVLISVFTAQYLFSGKKTTDIVNDSINPEDPDSQAVYLSKQNDAEVNPEATSESELESLTSNIKTANSERDDLTKTGLIKDSAGLLEVLNELLVSGAKLDLLVITELEMRIEITGLKNPDKAIAVLDKNNRLKNSQIAGSFNRDGKSVTILQSKPIGFNSKISDRNLAAWVKSAESNGLKTTGRSAIGDYEQVLNLIESQWENLFGFSKLYMAPSNGDWLVTVQ